MRVAQLGGPDAVFSEPVTDPDPSQHSSTATTATADDPAPWQGGLDYNVGTYIEGHRIATTLKTRTTYTAFPPLFIFFFCAAPIGLVAAIFFSNETAAPPYWSLALLLLCIVPIWLFPHYHVLAPSDDGTSIVFRTWALFGAFPLSHATKASEIHELEIIYNCFCDKLCLRTLCDLNMDFGLAMTYNDEGIAKAKAASGVLNCCVKRRSELWFWTHTGFRKFLDDVGLAHGGAEAGDPV